MWGQSQVNGIRKCWFTTLLLVSILINWHVGNVTGYLLENQDDILSNGGKLDKIQTINRVGRQESGITLISFLKTSVSRYGEKKVANSIHELAQHSLYDLVWLLAGDLEPWLIYDMYKMYNAASADDRVLSVYERFRAGQVNRTIVPEVFALDKEYNGYDWYKNVRTRLLESVDKYMAGSLVAGPPPKIEFDKDGKPIIEGKPEPEIAAVIAKSSTTTTKSPATVAIADEDPDDEESSDVDLDEIIEGFIS